MKNFLLALQFLTIIPVKVKNIDEKDISGSMIYFPLIGLLLGLILAGTNSLLYFLNFEQFFINIILVVLLIIFTGGLHLDGLADTFDAFSSRKNRFEMLKIMRDSRIGTMGVLSLISIVLIKISLVSSLSLAVKNASLILMCLLGRFSLVFSMFLFPYAREEGKAKVFVDGMNLKIFSLATAMTIVCSVIFLGLKGLVSFILVVIFVTLAGKFITNKIGGITGDTLGAINELVEVSVLLNIVSFTGVYI